MKQPEGEVKNSSLTVDQDNGENEVKQRLREKVSIVVSSPNLEEVKTNDEIEDSPDTQGQLRVSSLIGLHAERARSILELLEPSDSRNALVDKKSLPEHLKNFEKAMRANCKYSNAFVAKFKLDAKDNISLAFLVASDAKAALVVLGIQTVPLVIIALLLIYILGTGEDYTGPDLIRRATNLEVSIALLTLGIFYSATILGPLTRPYTVLIHFARIVGCCCGGFGVGILHTPDGEDDDLDIRRRLARGALSMLFRNFLMTGVIVMSGTVAILYAASIIGLLWTALALTWLSQIDVLLLQEAFHHFYPNTTITVAIDSLRWVDEDTRQEFWKVSWASETQIRHGLRNLDVPPHDKWALLTDPNIGLGLGSTSSLSPISCNMSIAKIEWRGMDLADIKELGPVIAGATHEYEWIYHMSKAQQRSFFDLYPIISSQFEWAGSVDLSHIGFRFEHSVALARILVLEQPSELDPVESLYINSNLIRADGASVLAEAIRNNLLVEKIYLHDNSIGDKGCIALADALKDNQKLRVLHLRSNGITDAGALALAEMLKVNTSLRELGLDNNAIGKRGVKALVETLKNHNRTLIKLWLNNNAAGEAETVRILAKNDSIHARVACADDSITPVIRNRIHKRLKTLRINTSRKRALRKLWNQALARRKLERAEIARTLMESKRGKISSTPRGLNHAEQLGEEIKKQDIQSIIDAIEEDERLRAASSRRLNKEVGDDTEAGSDRKSVAISRLVSPLWNSEGEVGE